MLDDGANLQPLRVLQERPEYAFDVVVGNDSGPLGRPLSMLSFVIDAVFFDASVGLFKQHNLLIHLLSSCLIMLLLLQLMRQSKTEHASVLALLATCAWLYSPMYVSTVLYIVQRMAQLAALFSLFGLILYACGRARQQQDKGGWLLILCGLLVGGLAIFAKENAIVFWPLVLLTEMVFFSLRASQPRDRWILRTAVYKVLPALLVALALFAVLKLGRFLEAFYLRDFTLWERILTQSRVLLTYIGEMLFPFRLDFGLFNDDYEVSRGFLSPVTTLYSMIAMAVLVAGAIGCCLREQTRLIGYGLAFFLVAHSVESTILPLEIYFEHRNYLPGVGLFIAAVSAIYQFGYRFLAQRAVTVSVGLVWIAGSLMVSGVIASIWSSASLFTLHSYAGHPGSLRAATEVSILYARAGDVSSSLAYLGRANQQNLESEQVMTVRELSLYCLADQPFPPELLQKLQPDPAWRLHPANESLNVLVQNISSGKCPRFQAQLLADRFEALFLEDTRFPPSTKHFALLAALDNLLQRYDRAERYVQKWLDTKPKAAVGLLMLLYFQLGQGDVQNASLTAGKLEALQAEGLLSVEQEDDLKMFRQALEAG